MAWRKSDRLLRGWIISKFKGLCDNLAAIGKPVLDQEKVFCLLMSLGPQYDWTMDSGASNHMTGKPGMLTNLRKYSGNDSVLIGDGSSMPILATGDFRFTQNNIALPLNDVLLVQNPTKNLLSISQLTTDIPVNCEFSNVDLCVKDRATGQTMMQGRSKGNLYVLPSSPELYFSHRFRPGTAESLASTSRPSSIFGFTSA